MQHYNHFLESTEYISKKAHVPESYFSNIYQIIKPDLYTEIKKTIPDGWGAEVTGVSGMEFRLVEIGKLKSFINETKDDMLGFGVGVLATLGASIAFSIFQSKHRKVVPYAYHYRITDEFQGIEEVQDFEEVISFYDDSFSKRIKKPKVVYYP